MRFWCSTLEVPWSWEFRAYPGIWAVVVLMTAPYLIAVKRRSDLGNEDPEQARRTRFFLAGMFAFWLATDWPLGLLGASYLASAHMLQFLLYTIVAAPLILLGMPEWMARRILGRLRLYRVAVVLARPIVAGVLFNLLLILTHAPGVVDVLRTSQFGSFVMDMVWLLMGLMVWSPIVSPLPEMKRVAAPLKTAYVFLALGVIPAIPAGFLTFADNPLYAIYELAPRVHGLSAGTDQQMAGLIMKIGGIPIIWGTMLAIMVAWLRPAELSAGSTVVSGSVEPDSADIHPADTDSSVDL